MARLLRVEYPGACYHVINRGHDRRNIFAGKGAAEAFEQVLDEAAVKFRWRVHAYVIMRNHFHFAAELSEPNLSVGMKWLQGTWTRRHSGLRAGVGGPFRGRFKALLVEPGHSLARVCHYIHLNPVRAEVVRADRLVEYRWSSLPQFSSRPRFPWLESALLLAEAGALPDSAVGWRRYQEFLASLAEDKTAMMELSAARLSRGWCVGSPAFKATIRKKIEERGSLFQLTRFASLEPVEIDRERESAWERRLLAVARRAKVDLRTLPAKKSDAKKVLLAAVLKQSTSVSNGWLAHRLAMGQPASVSQFVRRWMQRPTTRAKIETLLSQVKI